MVGIIGGNCNQGRMPFWMPVGVVGISSILILLALSLGDVGSTPPTGPDNSGCPAPELAEALASLEVQPLPKGATMVHRVSNPATKTNYAIRFTADNMVDVGQVLPDGQVAFYSTTLANFRANWSPQANAFMHTDVIFRTLQQQSGRVAPLMNQVEFMAGQRSDC